MPCQTVGFSDTEFRVNAPEFPVHFGVSGHRGKFRVPIVLTARYSHANTMHEPFEQAELSFGRKSRKLVFDLAERWRCPS